MGEIGVAVIVPVDVNDPPTLESLRQHAQNQLATYKLPEAIRIIDKLPRNTSDKVDRLQLRKGEKS